MKKKISFIKYPIAYIRLVLMLLVIFIFMVPGIIVNLFIKFDYDHKFSIRKACMKIILPILGIRINKLIGTPPLKHHGHLVVSNHRSFTDPLIQLRYINALPLSKAEVKNYPIFAQGVELTGILYIERANNKSRYNIRLAIRQALEKNINVFLYPEGTTRDAKLTSDYQSGSIKEAIATNSKIIPCVIEYKDKNDYWVGGSFHDQFIYQLGKWRSDVSLWFGEPMWNDDPMEFIKELREVTDEAIEELQREFK